MATGDGRLHGKAWEQILIARARSNGLLLLKNELSAKFIGGGGVKVLKSDLDFRMFDRSNPITRVSYFDAKTFDDPYFDYSWLQDNQIQRSVTYGEWGVPSGFVVWFRPVNEVRFYKGQQIAKSGPGTRFLPEVGVRLGSLHDFDLRAIYAA